jgi:hypothetical protein
MAVVRALRVRTESRATASATKSSCLQKFEIYQDEPDFSSEGCNASCWDPHTQLCKALVKIRISAAQFFSYQSIPATGI